MRKGGWGDEQGEEEKVGWGAGGEVVKGKGEDERVGTGELSGESL